MIEWISVEDKLPEPGEIVLCAHNKLVEYFCDVLSGKVDDSGNAEMKKGFLFRELITEDGGRWADEGVTHWHRITKVPEDGVSGGSEDV
jgi:hypothetical protein